MAKKQALIETFEFPEMKTSLFKYALTFGFSFMMVPNLSAQKHQPAEMGWLKGHWSGDLGGLTIVEQWEAGKAGSLEGKGFVIAGKDTVVVERMRINSIGEKLFFLAQINDNPAVAFTLVEINEKGEWVFENKEHDDPQRVIYSQNTSKGLYARTEGRSKAGEPVIDEYRYKKMP